MNKLTSSSSSPARKRGGAQLEEMAMRLRKQELTAALQLMQLRWDSDSGYSKGNYFASLKDEIDSIMGSSFTNAIADQSLDDYDHVEVDDDVACCSRKRNMKFCSLVDLYANTKPLVINKKARRE